MKTKKAVSATTLQKQIGKAIRAAREKKGWTAKQLGEQIHTLPFYIIQLENGQKGVSLARIAQLANLLDMKVDVIFYATGEKKQ